MNELEKALQENAHLTELITELANEYLEVKEDGSFTGYGFYDKALALKVNRALGIGEQTPFVSGKGWSLPLV